MTEELKTVIEMMLDRMANRPGKTIPDSVIESMMDSFVRPVLDEGFDTVRYYDMYGNSISS